MTVKALMPVRTVNLVAPLAHEATATCTTDTAAPVQARSGTACPLIGSGLRPAGVDRATSARTSGTRTSTTATRTTTTRATRVAPEPSVILLHESPAWLNAAHRDLEAWLPEQLHCHLNPRKTILQPVSRGVDFVGHVIKPWRRTTRPGTVTRAIERLQVRGPGLGRDGVRQLANSYFGLLRQATHSHHDRTRLANAVRDLGHSINGTFTKAYA